MPPTTVDEIPPSFFESHPQFEEKSFNALQTWTEYVNRLVGATIGLLMFATAVLSLAFWRKDKLIVLLSVAAMFLTGFEAWLGKLVVDKNLEGGMVTIHMFGAMVIMALLILANYRTTMQQRMLKPQSVANGGLLVWVGAFVLLLTVAQVLVGTQVREGVDAMNASLGGLDRDKWLQPSWIYTIHKWLWMVLAGMLAVWLVRVNESFSGERTIRWLILVVIGGIFSEVVFGMVLAYMDLPPVVQPIHMLFANLIFAAEFGIWIHAVGARLMARRPQSTES